MSRNPSDRYWIGPEEVNGTIVGGNYRPYEFWTTDQEYGQNRITRGAFANDREAIAWFKERYPEWFKRGVEMRVWDR